MRSSQLTWIIVLLISLNVCLLCYVGKLQFFHAGAGASGFAVTTITTRAARRRFERQLGALESYAARHGFAFLAHETREQPPHLGKVGQCARALRRHGTVLFADADNVVVTRGLHMSGFLPKKQVVFVGSPGFSSSHLFVLRRSRAARAFLGEWRRWQRVLPMCHFDQGAFLFAMLLGVADAAFPEKGFPFVHHHLHSCVVLLRSDSTHDKGSNCLAFQVCLMRWASYWVGPFLPACEKEMQQKPDGARLVDWNSSNPMLIPPHARIGPRKKKGIKERMAEMPFGWQCQIKDDTVLSEQGMRYSTFNSCNSNVFSVHPVKRWQQVNCTIK